MDDLAREAERLKLARVLHLEEAALAFLTDCDAATLRVIREGVTDALFAKFRPSFAGFARVSTRLPLAVSARIARRVLGPMLAGRVAGEMLPEQAIALAARLPDAFLADACIQMEPARAQGIVAGFPVARAVALTRILLARGEIVTMGRFVDVLPPETLFAATDAIENPADLLAIALFVENSAQLERVFAHLSIARRDGVLRVAAERDLWPRVIATLARVSRESRSALAARLLGRGGAALDSLIRAAAAHDLWPTLLAFANELDSPTRDRLVAAPAFDQAAVVRSVIDSVRAHDLWPAFIDQIPTLGVARAARLLEVAAGQRPAFLREMAARELPAPALAKLRAAAGELGAKTQARVIAACRDSALADRLAQDDAWDPSG